MNNCYASRCDSPGSPFCTSWSYPFKCQDLCWAEGGPRGARERPVIGHHCLAARGARWCASELERHRCCNLKPAPTHAGDNLHQSSPSRRLPPTLDLNTHFRNVLWITMYLDILASFQVSRNLIILSCWNLPTRQVLRRLSLLQLTTTMFMYFKDPHVG